MKSVKHTAAFTLTQPVEKLFPLFSPEGEKLWVPGWDYENVMGTIDLSENYVFLTKSHDHASTEAIWVVKSYEPEVHARSVLQSRAGRQSRDHHRPVLGTRAKTDAGSSHLRVHCDRGKGRTLRRELR